MLLLWKGVASSSVLFLAVVFWGALKSPVTAEEWTKARVRDLDITKGKILLDHDAIQKWGMPAMEMVFFVRNFDLLGGLQKADEVEIVPITVGKKVRRIKFTQGCTVISGESTNEPRQHLCDRISSRP